MHNIVQPFSALFFNNGPHFRYSLATALRLPKLEMVPERHGNGNGSCVLLDSLVFLWSVYDEPVAVG